MRETCSQYFTKAALAQTTIRKANANQSFIFKQCSSECSKDLLFMEVEIPEIKSFEINVASKCIQERDESFWRVKWVPMIIILVIRILVACVKTKSFRATSFSDGFDQ
jgi:hypothetical protein